MTLCRMDASDVIRKLRTQTRYNYLVSNLAKIQPFANISSPTVTSLSTIINYKDYDQRLDIALGKFYAVRPSTVTFIQNDT